MESMSSSSTHADGGAATTIPRISTNSIESPALAPCPLQLSEEAIASFAPELPPLDESRMSPAEAASAAALREKFASASSKAQVLMVSMREVWMCWNLLPIAPAGICATVTVVFFASPAHSHGATMI